MIYKYNYYKYTSFDFNSRFLLIFRSDLDGDLLLQNYTYTYLYVIYL